MASNMFQEKYSQSHFVLSLLISFLFWSCNSVSPHKSLKSVAIPNHFTFATVQDFNTQYPDLKLDTSYILYVYHDLKDSLFVTGGIVPQNLSQGKNPKDFVDEVARTSEKGMRYTDIQVYEITSFWQADKIAYEEMFMHSKGYYNLTLVYSFQKRLYYLSYYSNSLSEEAYIEEAWDIVKSAKFH